MVKSLILCLIILSFWSVETQDSCKPLWPRVEFGKTFAVSSDSQKLVIKFNTRSTCPNSYVTVSDLSGSIRKVPCQSSTLSLSASMNNYSTFIQRCSLTQIPFDQPIQYIAYGSNSSSTSSIPFDFNPINASILSPQRKQVKFVVLADWSQLQEKVGTYDSLNNTLDLLTNRERIDGIIVNGDIAYDLDSNNGTDYQMFLNLISRTARTVPIFFNTGNHEHNSKDDLDLFYGTFEQYGKDKKLAVGLNLGPLYLIGFDPYEALFSNKSSLRTQRAHSPSFQSYLGLQQFLAAGKQTQKILITSSHYPLMCSATNKNCQKDKILLKDYFDLMFQSNVQLYIGAHYHTYQRIYPYCQDGTIQKSQTPYSLNKCLISIIDGIAGNDDKIVETYPGLQPFTAKVSFGQTGFGLLSVSQAQVKYQHFSTKNVINLQDQFTINYQKQNQTQSNEILVINQ